MAANNSGHWTGFIATEPERKSEKAPFQMRVGVEQAGNSWQDTGYFTVTIFPGKHDKVIPHLKPGRRVSIAYTTRQKTWQSSEGGSRSSIDFILEDIQFIRMQEQQAPKPSEGDQPEMEAEASTGEGGDRPFDY
jgi:single-stranded DNA-binding protein